MIKCVNNGSTSTMRLWRSATSDIAVLIPCYNEAITIGKVVNDFMIALPECKVYVYDNNSTDDTCAIARSAGATVRTEPLQGKGHVVRRMFADIEADIYVLVDGDGTYDAAVVGEMVHLLLDQNLDMVTGTRQHETNDAYRRGHQFGNRVLTGAVRLIFGARITDMLSGYRVFSRRFVKSFPALAVGFETETEFTVHALELKMPVGEVLVKYGARPVGSTSKLNTIRDGIHISETIVGMVMRERPLLFFTVFALILFVFGLGFGLPIVTEYINTGLVPRFPTAFLSASLVVLSSLSFACGLILDSVSLGRCEAKRVAYLSHISPVAVQMSRRSMIEALADTIAANTSDNPR